MGKGESASKRTISKDEWEKRLSEVRIGKEEMNRLIMNFFVTEGYVDAAKAFAAESGTQPTADLDTITERMQIRQSIQSGHVEEAIDRVNDLNPEILEEQHHIFFHLQQQRLIELIRTGDTAAALDFAQEYLAPRGEEHQEFLQELERTVALLAFEDVQASPLAELMDVSQRQKTASELNAAILSSQGQEQEPRLPMLLKTMLWCQAQLQQRVDFPAITDLATGTLDDPVEES